MRSIVLLLLLLGSTCVLAQIDRDCSDQHDFCEFWASVGECEKNPLWMPFNCRRSCDTCDARRTTPQNQAQPLPTQTQQARPVTQPQPSGPRPQPRFFRNDVNSCSALLRGSQSNLQERLLDDGLLSTVENTASHRRLSLSTVRNQNTNQFCVPTINGAVDCQLNSCFHLRYRSMDGTCNNLRQPLWGVAFTKYRRLTSPVYDDGIAAPVGSINGGKPSAREASRFLLSSNQVVSNDDLSAFLMQWGQFMSHDIVKTTMLPNDNCRDCRVPHTSNCLSIEVNADDPNARTFGCQQSNGGPICCVRTARSSPICGTGTNGVLREQFNENTAFLDASMVYGSSTADMARFRAGRSGFLRSEFFNNQRALPFTRNNQGQVTMEAGDDRVNLFLGLAAMHTVFMREHNRIVNALQQINPQWDGDRLYHEARKIVGAQIQMITFKEYLPKMYGQAEFDRKLGAYRGYDENLEPTIANEFSVAAFRFGHGMVTEFFDRLSSQGVSIGAGGFSFIDGVFSSIKLLNEGGVDPIIRGLMTIPAKRPHRIITSMTEKLFGNVDLASVNIQRGRDHGLQGYNAFRRHCGMSHANTIDELSNEIRDSQVRENLRQGYGDPDSVDLYVAQLLEDPVPGGMIGPTLSCLLAEQFRRLREGDRFWYENPGIFTQRQVAELNRFTFARLLCDNGDRISRIPREVFRHVDMGSWVDCSQIPAIDLSAWREE